MTWLIACERSGAIRDAMLAAGVIAHPVCRYLTNAGAKHLYIGAKRENGPCPERWAAMRAAAAIADQWGRYNLFRSAA